MLKLLSATLFVLLVTFCDAQGSWEIGYLPIDTISKKHIGQVVRLDFKSKSPWIKGEGLRGIRSYVGIRDTAEISIDTTAYIVAERRKIYADHGSYSDQYLECINCKQYKVVIYDAKILDVDRTSIQFQLDIEVKRNDKVTDKQIKTVRIDRSVLDGVMYREQL